MLDACASYPKSGFLMQPIIFNMRQKNKSSLATIYIPYRKAAIFLLSDLFRVGRGTW